MKYTAEDIYKFAISLNGKVIHNTLGGHRNELLAKMPLDFGDWYFTSWFNFKDQTANTPVYWNKKFYYSILPIPINEFLDEVKFMIKTNSLSIDSRNKYFKFN